MMQGSPPADISKLPHPAMDSGRFQQRLTPGLGGRVEVRLATNPEAYRAWTKLEVLQRGSAIVFREIEEWCQSVLDREDGPA